MNAYRQFWADDGQPFHNPVREGLPTIRPEQLPENIRKPAADLICPRGTRASSRGYRATVDNVISTADKRASV